MSASLTMPCPRCWSSRTEPGGSQNPCILCAGTGATADQELGPHYRLSEFLASQTAVRRCIPNDPSPEVVGGLQRLVSEVLEPLRPRTGPLQVDSGYRSNNLNTAVGGSATSAHRFLYGASASDLKPAPGSAVTLRQLFEIIRTSGIPFDQLIWEFGHWVHVGQFGPGGRQSGAVEMIFNDGRGYRPFDPDDPRVER